MIYATGLTEIRHDRPSGIIAERLQNWAILMAGKRNI